MRQNRGQPRPAATQKCIFLQERGDSVKAGDAEGCVAVRAACTSRDEGCPRPEGGEANLNHH